MVILECLWHLDLATGDRILPLSPLGEEDPFAESWLCLTEAGCLSRCSANDLIEIGSLPEADSGQE